MPATSLPALERQLEARLLELDRLQRARRRLDSAKAWARTSRQIDANPALTLADATVKLRRLTT